MTYPTYPFAPDLCAQRRHTKARRPQPCLAWLNPYMVEAAFALLAALSIMWWKEWYGASLCVLLGTAAYAALLWAPELGAHWRVGRSRQVAALVQARCRTQDMRLVLRQNTWDLGLDDLAFRFVDRKGNYLDNHLWSLRQLIDARDDPRSLLK